MNEKLSALIDGDLDDLLTSQMIDQLNRNDSLRKDWDIYCLIGDVLRDEHGGTPDMVGRVMAGLDSEPTVLAPRGRPAEAVRRGLWQSLMPIAASVMGVAAVGLVAATMYGSDGGVAPVAAAKRAGAGTVSQAATLVSATPDEVAHREYLFVHQAMTGGGSMPGASQYVRTVSAQFKEAAQ